MTQFLADHFDAIITVLVTVIGFIVTYFMTRRDFKNEIKKDKLSLTAEAIQTLPFDICKLMDATMGKTGVSVEQYRDLLSKVLSYGSKNAVDIAIKMQQISYFYEKNKGISSTRTEMLAAYSLLITQLKYEITSEVISPESWFQLRLKDYGTIQVDIKAAINKLVNELDLNKDFLV
ncbi:MAG: hypothetical protein HDT20_02610 [Oscillibacter sp.]|nr:hypothetical protein [Oscillibacter sp.]